MDLFLLERTFGCTVGCSVGTSSGRPQRFSSSPPPNLDSATSFCGVSLLNTPIIMFDGDRVVLLPLSLEEIPVPRLSW